MLQNAVKVVSSGLLAAAVGLGAFAQPQATAEELVYGSCVPASDYLTTSALPAGFKLIEEETKGAVKWKAIAGAAIADCKATFSAVKDDLMQGGLAIPTYVPNPLPSSCVSSRSSRWRTLRASASERPARRWTLSSSRAALRSAQPCLTRSAF